MFKTSVQKKEYDRQYYLSHKKERLEGRYASYKCTAKQRSKDFNLSLEEFKMFWKQPCYYCGDSINTIELDRIDNNKGYSKDNIVSCCKACNAMKSTLSQEKFIKHITKIGKHLSSMVFMTLSERR